MSKNAILVIPCSGIGKPFGTIGRDATFRVVDELRRGEADTNCLSLIVMGDEGAIRQIRGSRCIAVDGCPLECARKNIEIAGGRIAAHFRVMDLLRENRGLKPRRVTFLDEDGSRLSEILAEKIAVKVDELRGESP
ncbi:MAG: putative zinc-binding protein [Candidatus Bathyarchaeota archaeon]|nr:putative zinc-binding protein [Candidatus Bathyarchaeota archaeon]